MRQRETDTERQSRRGAIETEMLGDGRDKETAGNKETDTPHSHCTPDAALDTQGTAQHALDAVRSACKCSPAHTGTAEGPRGQLGTRRVGGGLA